MTTAGVRAPEINSSENQFAKKSIVSCRVAADSIELICSSRDYAEPSTVLPNGRTSDESDTPLSFDGGLL